MRYKQFILGLVAVAALALLPTAARADNVSFAFTPSTYTASAGSVVTLFGTFTNGAGAITFSGYSDSLQAGLSLSPNGNPGSQPFDALVGLSSNQTLGPIAFFNVLIAAGTPDGTGSPSPSTSSSSSMIRQLQGVLMRQRRTSPSSCETEVPIFRSPRA